MLFQPISRRGLHCLRFDSTFVLSENSPVSVASLNKADIFYGYFDIFEEPKWTSERCRVFMTSFFQLSHKIGQNCYIKIRAQILWFSKICEILGYFRHQIMLNQLIKHTDALFRYLLEKNLIFLKNGKMPKIVFPISPQIDNSID